MPSSLPDTSANFLMLLNSPAILPWDPKQVSFLTLNLFSPTETKMWDLISEIPSFTFQGCRLS